ncbi:N-acetylmuramoyl-L-alanine amidase [Deinobacterium chartae]|uniref:N-acetylmuramoyl-L-alanine amidase n=1 Tax=Deinobacterium chartae TaxID=521158 RepID=A0A841HWU9_9DEIO|nr:N-acetylmuramoyl-L-alanine amidase [Deinobacterium chartae]MBB6096719.1 N-acetylmuramoyl-L-alanine amidase [Deinobacterium chartae]
MRFKRRWIALGACALLTLAAAQVTVSRLQLNGRSQPSILLYGQEYVRRETLAGEFQVTRDGDLIRVEQGGRVALIPLDYNSAAAPYQNYVYQSGFERRIGQAATVVNGNLYLPVATLAQAFGAEYTPGRFQQGGRQLLGVASKAEAKYDRLVLTLSRGVTPAARLEGDRLVLSLPGTSGKEATYTTRGKFLKRAVVTAKNGGLTVSADLPSGAGYRLHTLPPEPGRPARVILDAGPAFEREQSALEARVLKPLVVIDAGHGGTDPGVGRGLTEKAVTLELAREVGRLLSKAGWVVRYTRTSDTDVPLAERADLARRSDVFLSLHLGGLPGARGSGAALYRLEGDSPLQLIHALRSKDTSEFPLAVSPPEDSARLGAEIATDLKRAGFDVHQRATRKLYLLEQAPRAALLVELGWPSSDADLERLEDPQQLRSAAAAIARAVARYLTPPKAERPENPT